MFIKKIFTAVCFLMALRAAGQEQIVTRGDTLVLPNGSKFWLGEEVTLGTGSMPDKSFSFIYFPMPLNIKGQSLKATYAGQRATIKKFQRDGAYKKSYSYNILVLDFSDRRRFWCDVQNAVVSNELINNNPVVNKGGQAESKEERLAKLKKLYDTGQITQDEYETLKNKIMNEKEANTKKQNQAPAVF